MTTYGHLKMSKMHFSKIKGVGEGIHPHYSESYESNAPPPKFIRSLSLFIYILYAPGALLATLDMRFQAGGGGFILKNAISGPFNYVEKNGCFIILIGCV